MPTVVIMPALGMAQDTGKVVRWLRAEGDAVERGEPLLEIETDKVTVEIEAPADGALAGDLRGRGRRRARSARRSPGCSRPASRCDAVARRSPRAGRRAQCRPPWRRAARAALASPKARRLAASRGVDLAAVRGSGPGRRDHRGGHRAVARRPAAGRRDARSARCWRVMARADDRELAGGAAVPPPPRRRRDAAAELARRRPRKPGRRARQPSPTCS